MSFVIELDPTITPARADGSRWPAVFVNPAGVSLFADGLGEIVGEIIPGYKDAGVDGQFELRVDSLASLATGAQAAILAGSADAAELDDDTLTALLAGKDGLALEFDEWQSDIPLILLATNYSPYTDVPRPAGDAVVWLDAHDERTYLLALNSLGAGELYTTNEE